MEGIKYIDYDLDVKLFPNGDILVLDRDEYDFNIKNLNYSEEIKSIIETNLKMVLKKIDNKEEPFNKESIMKWFEYSKQKEKNEGY